MATGAEESGDERRPVGVGGSRHCGRSSTLRPIARQDMSMATLEEVVEDYGQRGIQHLRLSARVLLMGLPDEESVDLVKFLTALSGGGGHSIEASPPEEFPH